MTRSKADRPVVGSPSRARKNHTVRLRLTAVTAGTLLLLSMSAAPTFAFIHEFIPAGQGATSEIAGDSPTAEDHLRGVPMAKPPAPDDCPAPQK